LSARSPGELAVRARQVVAYVQDRPELDAVDVGYSLALGRSGLPCRVAVTGRDRETLVRLLAAVGQGQDVVDVCRGQVTSSAGGVVCVFRGEGAQWLGVGLELMEFPVFAESIMACAAALDEFVDWALLDVLGDEVALERVDVLQPALWAVMVSLAALWRSWG